MSKLVKIDTGDGLILEVDTGVPMTSQQLKDENVCARLIVRGASGKLVTKKRKEGAPYTDGITSRVLALRKEGVMDKVIAAFPKPKKRQPKSKSATVPVSVGAHPE